MKEETVKLKGPFKKLLGAILNLCSIEQPLVAVAQWETKIDDKLIRLEFISIINNNQILSRKEGCGLQDILATQVLFKFF
jgi:hypothetical protein